MKVGSLFSGIGGFDLGLERAGMEIVWQVEIDPFCNKVLAKHWPNVKRYGDIKDVTNLEPVDLICGGFPCQPFSCAGKRRGKEDNRFLWPEMLRVVSEAKPRWVIGENVAGFIDMGLDDCISDLENQGYEVQPFIIPACALNAPHRRDRVWIVGQNSGRCGFDTGSAPMPRQESRKSLISNTDCHVADTASKQAHSTEQRGFHSEFSGENCDVSNSKGIGLQGSVEAYGNQRPKSNDQLLYGCRRDWLEPWPEVASRLCKLDDGLPDRLARPDRNRNRVKKLKALGNAVVPQIVEIIGKTIMRIENCYVNIRPNA